MLKEDVLVILDRERDTFHSGRELCDRLHTRRDHVWRAIRALRSDGITIESSPEGFRLSRDCDILCAPLVAGRLTDRARFYDIRVRSSLSSTNVTLCELARQGAEDGKVLIALRQTAGHGRFDRYFFSPPGTGLYMSILFRRPIPAAQSLYLTTAAAVAVAESIEEISRRPAGIKWVNDVTLDGRKVAGILTEGAVRPGTSLLDWAVIGIGVNLAPPDGGFPPELDGIAGSVFATPAPSGTRARLAAAILERMAESTARLADKPHLASYRKHSFLPGRQITVLRGREERRAVALEIDDEFRLVVRYEGGSTETLESGEVSTKLTRQE